MLFTSIREWMRGLAPKTLQLGCLIIAFLVPSFASAEWQDPLNTASVQTDRAHKSLLLDITRADNRLVAVGGHGHIIYSDDNGIHWKQAKVPVAVTLTKVFFVSGQIGWAVGHDGDRKSTRLNSSHVRISYAVFCLKKKKKKHK